MKVIHTKKNQKIFSLEIFFLSFQKKKTNFFFSLGVFYFFVFLYDDNNNHGNGSSGTSYSSLFSCVLNEIKNIKKLSQCREKPVRNQRPTRSLYTLKFRLKFFIRVVENLVLIRYN